MRIPSTGNSARSAASRKAAQSAGAVRIDVLLPPELHRKLMRCAEQQGLALSEMVRRIVAIYKP